MAITHGIAHGAVRSLVILAATLCLAASVYAADFEVIAHKNVPVSTLSKAELKSIFLGEKVKWDNNKYIKIVVPEQEAAYKDFLQNVVGKTPSQFDKHWMNLVFTGRGAMPQAFADSQKLVDYVAGHPGVVGVVAAGQAGASVKTIAIK